MLINPGDLIPVRSEAIQIPWTKRKSTILNFLHRGPVTFKTYVYDTNVGDISSLATYFNPERWTNQDLNTKFGHKPKTNLAQAVAEGGIYQNSTASNTTTQSNSEDAPSVLPRLLLYPQDEESSNLETPPLTPPQTPTIAKSEDKEKDTFQWVINQQVETSTSKTNRDSTTTNNLWPSKMTSESKLESMWKTSSDLQKPCEFWRYGSTGSVSNDTTVGGFWAWNPTSSKNTRSDSTSSSTSSDQEQLNGWPMWNSGPSSMTGSSESSSVFRPFDTEENFLLGESLVKNLTRQEQQQPVQTNFKPIQHNSRSITETLV